MDAIDSQTGNTLPRRQHSVKLLLLVGCVLAIGGAVYWLQYCPISGIEPEDVASMQLTIYGRLVGKAEKISLRPEAIPDILMALKPCRRDWSGIKWESIGMLEIVLKNGAKYHLDLYETQHDETAFSIDGWHYFGGSETTLNGLLVRESLRDALNDLGILKRPNRQKPSSR